MAYDLIRSIISLLRIGVDGRKQRALFLNPNVVDDGGQVSADLSIPSMADGPLWRLETMLGDSKARYTSPRRAIRIIKILSIHI